LLYNDELENNHCQILHRFDCRHLQKQYLLMMMMVYCQYDDDFEQQQLDFAKNEEIKLIYERI
jgi:hypothetical protein